MTDIDPAALRAELDLTLAEMALLLGVNSSTVWRWEQGRTTPTARHRRKLARLDARKAAAVRALDARENIRLRDFKGAAPSLTGGLHPDTFMKRLRG